MMLMKRHLEKAHSKATPLDKAWTIIEYLVNEARDYITNKSGQKEILMKKFSRCWHVDSERDQARSTFNNSSGLEIKTARKIICSI